MVSHARVGASTVLGPDELDALSLGLVVADGRGEIVRWTRALAELTGIATHEALGTSLWERLPALRDTPAEAAVLGATRDRVPYRGAALPLSTGEPGLVLRSVAPLGDDAILLEIDRSPSRVDAAAAERSVRDAHALTEVIQSINQSLELDRVPTLLAEYAARLGEGVGATVYLADDDALRAAGCYGTEGPSLGSAVPLDDAFPGACLRARKPLHSSDLSAFTSTPQSANSALAVPLLVADRAIGVIVVVRGPSPRFDARDEEILTVLASHGAIAIENARLFRAAARTMHHTSILASNARALARHVTAKAMFADIVRIAREALRADGVGIYLATPGSDHVDVALQEGAGHDVIGSVQQWFWETPLGDAMRSGRPVLLGALEPHGDVPTIAVLLDIGIRAGAILPLMIEGKARGVLTLRYRRIQAFDPEERQLLTDFGTHVALAVRNGRLFEDLERRAARFEAVAQVQRAISETVSLNEVYSKIYSAVASVVDSPCFVLLSFDEDTGVFVPEYCINDGKPIETDTLPRFPPGSGNTTQAFLTRQPNVAARSRAGWSGQVHVTAGRGEVAVVLSAPILHGDRALGVLQAQSYDPEAYDWDDVDLVMLIARQAGTAIVNARAFETERRELERAPLAAAVARAALAAGDLEPGADAALSGLAGACPASGRTIARMGAGGARRTVATRGVTPARDDTGTIRVPLSSGERARGELLVRDTGLPNHVRETLCRLADPLALALETLQLREEERHQQERRDRKSTRLNSSHLVKASAVLCLHKKEVVLTLGRSGKYTK